MVRPLGWHKAFLESMDVFYIFINIKLLFLCFIFVSGSFPDCLLLVFSCFGAVCALILGVGSWAKTASFKSQVCPDSEQRRSQSLACNPCSLRNRLLHFIVTGVLKWQNRANLWILFKFEGLDLKSSLFFGEGQFYVYWLPVKKYTSLLINF